jgi:acyl-CoA reductase-like NAD-dependent aldehyde dehydrogenase
MSMKPKTANTQAAPARFANEVARAEDAFNKQKAYFASDATKTYEWRIDQLDRLIRMLKDNHRRFCDALCDDFKTAVQENAFEVSASIASGEFTKSQLREWMMPSAGL